MMVFFYFFLKKSFFLGSIDNTCEIAMNYSKIEGSDHIRVLKLLKNRGKGGAVKRV